MRLDPDDLHPLIVNWGGGVNSTAMLVGMLERDIRPDRIIFADTWAEKPETYEFAWRFEEWLESVGFPPLIVVYATSLAGTLEERCLSRQELPSLAYGFKTCSQKYKREPIEKWENNHWPRARTVWACGFKITKAVGFDAGEERRAHIEGDAKHRYWYPLIEWGWSREDCLDAIARAGLAAPPKSSCFFCPSMKKAEILDLRDRHPDLLARALRLESNAVLKTDRLHGLGRYFNWSAFVAASEAEQREMTGPATEIACDCFDGGED